VLDREELLNESYSQFQWSLSNRGKYEINQMIQSKVKYLNEAYGLEREDMRQHLFENFLARRHYQKYDPGKTKLSTFVTHYTNLSLANLIRSYETLDKNYREIPLDEGTDDARDNRGCSLAYLEGLGHEGMVDWTTPEDNYNGKELWNLMVDFFDEDDVLVLMGFKDRHAEAKRLGIDYHAYRKRLNRKVSAFKSLLKELGYL
jgi:hypothetical protein